MSKAYVSTVKAMSNQPHSYSFGDYNQVTVLYEADAKDFFSPTVGPVPTAAFSEAQPD